VHGWHFPLTAIEQNAVLPDVGGNINTVPRGKLRTPENWPRATKKNPAACAAGSYELNPVKD
ncbi:hypothetical protein NY486_06775, partial [Enterobacter hormaechei]|nr:hypothetical protein [Enterobacter hormaechei]